MIVTKVSMISRKTHSMDLPITQERLNSWIANRTLVQDAFPELTAPQREFLMTGITPEEWERAFPKPDDEDELE